LSYLIDKINILYREEKILVFYEGDDIAYYCAQALELLGIPHLIYASGIAQHLRNDYQTLFNTDNTYRVLLMDLKQAALGLHMASASRVFFINPVWQPAIEAQAIKRAHRIGQTKPVFVETLVLKDTMEDAMLQRRKSMTVEEHQKAARSMLDDNHMKDVIQQAKLLTISPQETNNASKQYAPLQKPQQVFARSFFDTYGSHEAAMLAWSHLCPLQHEYDEVNDEYHYQADDEMGIESIINAHPDILKQVAIAPDLPTTTVETMINGAKQAAATRASKKRKLNFVDELEKRKMSASTKKNKNGSPKKGFSGSKAFAGIKKSPARKGSKLRTVQFADEHDQPLVTTMVLLPKASPSPEPIESVPDVNMNGA
jgi:hypothetical protein